MVRQHGAAGRDQYNVGRDFKQVNVKVGPGSLKTVLDNEGLKGGFRNRSLKGVIIAVAIVVVFIYSALSSSSKPRPTFPKQSARWPAGATAVAVMAPVLSKLRECSQAPVLKPVTCPQSLPYYYSDAANIRWSLHGNAADGAKIVYWANRFDVAGNAVMRVTYSDFNGSDVVVKTVHYRALLQWQSGHAVLIEIKGVSSASNPKITKHMPSVTWNQVRQAVRSAFYQCAATSSGTLPVQCPRGQYSDVAGSHVHWRLTSDPLINARETFDPTSGLIHVIGSYSLRVTYSDVLFGKQKASQNGNYNAIASVDGQKIDVLQIAASN